jgi:aspartyl-tRNA(Asn)/glutamyl-tRNA(Gln) amidotransferase subunit C
MKISIEEIKKTAKLAKFDITEDEAQLYAAQMSDVLSWVEQLQNVDTTAGAEPRAQGYAQLRADGTALNPAAKDIAAAFNDKENNLLKVNKVL